MSDTQDWMHVISALIDNLDQEEVDQIWDMIDQSQVSMGALLIFAMDLMVCIMRAVEEQEETLASDGFLEAFVLYGKELFKSEKGSEKTLQIAKDLLNN